MSIKYLTLFLVVIGIRTASAENLEDIYKLAIQNDQTFQNATATRQAAAEALPQAMAALFPQISGQANSAMNRQWTQYQSAALPSNTAKYNSKGYQLNLTMPLIDFADWYTVSEQKAAVKAADATYADAAQSLIIRTAQAYFGVLQAEDTLRNTQTNKDLLAKQLAQAKARYSVGVDALTSVYNAQAAYDTAVATEIADQSALYAAYQNLQVMTGKPIDRLSRLTDKLPLLQPIPSDLSAWQKAAENRNFGLLALRYTADSNREGVKLQNAGHLPTLSTVNSYIYNHQTANNGSTAGDATTNSSIGLQVNVPIFAGGQVLSQTRQAQDEYVEAMTNLELDRRQVVASTFQTYSNILSGISKIKADRAAIKSSNSALQSDQAAYQAGTMTIVDVLQAVNNLYTAQQTYTADQYAYLINTLTLKQLAGNLTNIDVTAMNQWLNNGDTISASEVEQQALAPQVDTVSPTQIKKRTKQP